MENKSYEIINHLAKIGKDGFSNEVRPSYMKSIPYQFNCPIYITDQIYVYRGLLSEFQLQKFYNGTLKIEDCEEAINSMKKYQNKYLIEKKLELNL